MTTSPTTQLRAICSICFRQQAVDAYGRIAQHGYRRKDGWHHNIGVCGGAGHSHFGTEAGVALTRSYAQSAQCHAADVRARAARIDAGTEPLYTRQGDVIAAPTATQRRDAHDTCLREAKRIDAFAETLLAAADAWTPAEAVAVPAPRRSAPLLHYRNGQRGNLCARSLRAAQQQVASLPARLDGPGHVQAARLTDLRHRVAAATRELARDIASALVAPLPATPPRPRGGSRVGAPKPTPVAPTPAGAWVHINTPF